MALGNGDTAAKIVHVFLGSIIPATTVLDLFFIGPRLLVELPRFLCGEPATVLIHLKGPLEACWCCFPGPATRPIGCRRGARDNTEKITALESWFALVAGVLPAAYL